MSEPFIGEIRLVGFNFQINGWAFCNGALQAISENPALFQLIGTTYGGDGQNTFALPNLQGRIPFHQGQGAGLNNMVIGQIAGEESVSLTIGQLPAHSHQAQASGSPGNLTVPAGNVWAAWGDSPYTTDTDTGRVNMDPAAVSTVGGSQPHENRPPFLVMNYVISLFGVFPSQN